MKDFQSCWLEQRPRLFIYFSTYLFIIQLSLLLLFTFYYFIFFQAEIEEEILVNVSLVWKQLIQILIDLVFDSCILYPNT